MPSAASSAGDPKIPAPIAGAFRAIAGSDHVRVDGLGRYRLGAAVPAIAVLPGAESEVSRILALAAVERLGVVPWGGGCHQSTGYVPARYHVALDLGRLNRLVEHEPDDMTATIQAGVRVGELQRQLAARGQLLPLDPPLAERASLGGVLALNFSGPLRGRYGTARDLVLGIRVAQADGTLTRAGAKVVKNATAYDITKLYLGSCGTLGTILEATLRLYPLPARERGWWFALPDLAAGQALATRILGSHLNPNRVELLDAAAGAACDGPGAGPTLLVSCAGATEAVEEQETALADLARQAGAGMAAIGAREVPWAALRDLFWSGEDGRGVGAIWRASVLPAECARAMRAVQEASRGRGSVSMAATVAAGSLRGECRAPTPDGLLASLRAAREALEGLGGFLVVLAAPSRIRESFDAWGHPPEGIDVMRRLKAAFDPDGILNPGRFVGRI